jgi:pimeloyl-ACP methyl ester carboxylesterase
MVERPYEWTSCGCMPQTEPSTLLSDTARLQELSGGRVRVQVIGPLDGIPVLFIHGLSYPMEVWDPLWEALGGELRLARYDLYGRGRSDYSGQPLGPEELAEQALETAGQLGLSPPFHVVTLSNGDLVACELAAKHPEQIASLALVAPSGIDRRTMSPWARLRMGLPGGAALFGGLLRRSLATRMREHWRHLPNSAPPASAEVYRRAISSAENHPPFAAAVMSQIHNMPTEAGFRSTLREVAGAGVQVALLRFGHEKDSTEDGLAVFQEILPKIMAEHIPSGSHMALLELPSEIAASLRRLWKC